LKEFDELIATLKKNRECPWCKELTIEAMKKEILSEAKEVADEIDNKDYPALKDELGDLLMDTLHIAILCEEQGLFKAKDVLEMPTKKLHRRKPWIFGNEKVANKEEAVKRWNEIKAEEKKAKNSNK
jgi:uncharacterized protein YabN with tetrapyrrole methylase and pyrophosphatase domain